VGYRFENNGGAPESLTESLLIQARASEKGFDWDDVRGVLDKVGEEVAEIEDALRQGDAEHARRELGDLLFAVVNLARFLEADPSSELREANRRFSERFNKLETALERKGISMRSCTLEELDVVWEEIKKELRKQSN